jgi:predicted 3-demethylubiquinone-9 3-methyltransferase (glyoxalase superfamily)
MQKIIPNLWFDHTAAEAVRFYTEAFPDAAVIDTQYYPHEGLLDFQEELAGQELMIEFTVAGYRLIAINAGPEFTPTPSLSLMVNFDPSRDPAAREHLDELWNALSDGGQALMPLQSYDFSPHYGWIQDRYGISWQLILTNPDGEPRPMIVPNLLFGDGVQNRAADAAAYYLETFPGSRNGTDVRYQEQVGPAAPGSVMFSDIELFGQWFALMDSAVEQDFTFNNAVSLMVECDDQAEIDRYWAALSAVPEAEQCGWCTDKFGVSWQIIPVNMGELMATPNAFPTMLAMRKIDIAGFGV